MKREGITKRVTNSLGLLLALGIFNFILTSVNVMAISLYSASSSFGFGVSNLARNEIFSLALLFVFFFVLLLTPISKVIKQYPLAVIVSVIISIFGSFGLTAKYGSLITNPVVLAAVSIVVLFIIIMKARSRAGANIGVTFLILGITSILIKYFLCDKLHALSNCSMLNLIGITFFILALLSFLLRMSQKPDFRLIQPWRRRPQRPRSQPGTRKVTLPNPPYEERKAIEWKRKQRQRTRTIAELIEKYNHYQRKFIAERDPHRRKRYEQAMITIIAMIKKLRGRAPSGPKPIAPPYEERKAIEWKRKETVEKRRRERTLRDLKQKYEYYKMMSAGIFDKYHHIPSLKSRNPQERRDAWRRHRYLQAMKEIERMLGV